MIYTIRQILKLIKGRPEPEVKRTPVTIEIIVHRGDDIIMKTLISPRSNLNIAYQWPIILDDKGVVTLLKGFEFKPDVETRRG